jgi:transposase-like protein
LAKTKWTEHNKEKRKIANAVNNAVRDKKLIKPNVCQECGKTNCRIEGHHDDYSKPLDVRWLCSACHRAWHKLNGTVDPK